LFVGRGGGVCENSGITEIARASISPRSTTEGSLGRPDHPAEPPTERGEREATTSGRTFAHRPPPISFFTPATLGRYPQFAPWCTTIQYVPTGKLTLLSCFHRSSDSRYARRHALSSATDWETDRR